MTKLPIASIQIPRLCCVVDVAGLGRAAAVAVRRRRRGRRPEARPAEAPRDGGPAPAPALLLPGTHLFPAARPGEEVNGLQLLPHAHPARLTARPGSLPLARWRCFSLPLRRPVQIPRRPRARRGLPGGQQDKCDAGECKGESESERWRAVGVHKSEKQAGGSGSVAGSVVVAVGRPARQREHWHWR